MHNNWMKLTKRRQGGASQLIQVLYGRSRAMLTVECEPATTSACDCCGGTTTRLTRFVSRDGDALGIYYAAFSANHPDRTVKVVISLGEWGDGSGPQDRCAFAIDMRASEKEYQVILTDAAACPWRDSKILGRVLDREEALGHPWVQEVFHLADHMVIEDKRLKEYLDGGAV